MSASNPVRLESRGTDGDLTREPWAVVLAGGDGTRLATLTATAHGLPVPKQFCSLTGRRSLLRLALDRATALAPPARVVAVVAARHSSWWQPELADLPRENVVVQPSNRGTALGVLLPLLHIARRDPRAVVAILPSDHYVAEEPTFRSSLAAAVANAARHPGRVLLLGVTPESPDPDYGWIVPGPTSPDGTARVRQFREKPGASTAARLMQRGALVSSFVLAATADALLAAFATRLPWLVDSFRRATSRGRGGASLLAPLYEGLPERDFSRHVLEPAPERLRVLPVPACGWSDLGTPERVAACVRGRHEAVGPLGQEPRSNMAPVELAALLAAATSRPHPLGGQERRTDE